MPFHLLIPLALVLAGALILELRRGDNPGADSIGNDGDDLPYGDVPALPPSFGSDRSIVEDILPHQAGRISR